VLPELSYTLAVSGTGGNDFSESRTVEVTRKTLSIFVQTDKAMYKPGQKGTGLGFNVTLTSHTNFYFCCNT